MQLALQCIIAVQWRSKNGLIRLRKELGLPGTFAEAGVDIRQLRQNMDKIVAATLEDPCCQTNPVPVTPAVVRQILEAVAGRG